MKVVFEGATLGDILIDITGFMDGLAGRHAGPVPLGELLGDDEEGTLTRFKALRDKHGAGVDIGNVRFRLADLFRL